MSSYLSQITEPLIIQTYATLFFATLVLCLVIILASGHGFSRRAALDASAVQSAHSGFVPRVGGLAIYISLLGLIPLLSFGFIPLGILAMTGAHNHSPDKMFQIKTMKGCLKLMLTINI